MTLRRLAAIVTGLAALSYAARRTGLLCATRGQHDPQRQFIGGWRCRVCSAVGVDLQDAGLQLDGYVSETATLFNRRHGGEVSRSARWEKH